MDLGLKGKTALVLGASGGLGGAIAESLAREGASVALAGRRLEPLEDRARHLRDLGARALPVVWDLAEPEAIERVVSSIEESLGGIDILVNNTGGPAPTPVAGQPASEWHKQFQAMVLSAP